MTLKVLLNPVAYRSIEIILPEFMCASKGLLTHILLLFIKQLVIH